MPRRMDAASPVPSLSAQARVSMSRTADSPPLCGSAPPHAARRRPHSRRAARTPARPPLSRTSPRGRRAHLPVDAAELGARPGGGLGGLWEVTKKLGQVFVDLGARILFGGSRSRGKCEVESGVMQGPCRQGGPGKERGAGQHTPGGASPAGAQLKAHAPPAGAPDRARAVLALVARNPHRNHIVCVHLVARGADLAGHLRGLGGRRRRRRRLGATECEWGALVAASGARGRSWAPRGRGASARTLTSLRHWRPRRRGL